MRELRPGLWQGDVHDLNSLKDRKHTFTLAVNVGSTNWLPPDMFTVHFPMKDGDGALENDWTLLIPLAYYVANIVRTGKRVLCNCDAGISRSIVFCGIVISILESRSMDLELMYEISTSQTLPPHRELWEEASKELIKHQKGLNTRQN